MAWFRKTGQRWKLAIFTLACATIPFAYTHGASRDGFRNTLVSVAGLGVFFWFWASVRCPFCEGRPMWFMARQMNARAFNPWDLQHCPICRDTGDVRPTSAPLFSAYRGM